jgi:hypothetical protein
MLSHLWFILACLGCSLQLLTRLAMRYLAVVAMLVVAATAAGAQTPGPTCKAQAEQKKLAGAALKSFMTKCEKDASAACGKSAADNKLAGAAKTSHVKKCVSDAVGN